MNSQDRVITYKGSSMGLATSSPPYEIICGKCGNEFKAANLRSYNCPKCVVRRTPSKVRAAKIYNDDDEAVLTTHAIRIWIYKNCVTIPTMHGTFHKFKGSEFFYHCAFKHWRIKEIESDNDHIDIEFTTASSQ